MPIAEIGAEQQEEAFMVLEMRNACGRCGKPLPLDGAEARICSYECTFCRTCAGTMNDRCPNCGGELLPRPRRMTVE
ncbi:MAG TPA: DUF1272 domain-containing protein [Rhizomicrobium sp.]|nr:DUF1272 domain-containing protein [Rhizomicrobium sp.]